MTATAVTASAYTATSSFTAGSWALLARRAVRAVTGGIETLLDEIDSAPSGWQETRPTLYAIAAEAGRGYPVRPFD